MSELEDFPVVVERPLSWGQMDAFQHLNNVQYFRMFEDARIAYFETMGIYDAGDPEPMSGIGPILGETSCKFIAPVTYPDRLFIGARTANIAEDRFFQKYAIFSDQLQRIAAVGDSTVVTFDYDTGKKTDVPDSWRRAIEELEGY